MKLNRLLKLGVIGEDVGEWQRILINDGHDLSPCFDSEHFNEITHNATVSWQKDRLLVGDGIVGKETVKKIGTKPVVLPDPLKEELNITFKQARNYTPANRTEADIKWIVLHSMEAGESSNTAENVAAWFASKAAPKASAHFCVVPDTKILLKDLTWTNAENLMIGSELWATEEFSPGHSGRTLKPSVVLNKINRKTNCVKITFDDNRILKCSLDHKLLVKPPAKTAMWEWMSVNQLKEKWNILAPFEVWENDNNYDFGYLGGIFDGEGCLHKCNSITSLSFSQKEGYVLERSCQLLDKYNINYNVSNWRKETNLYVIRISGLQSVFKLLGISRPIRLLNKIYKFEGTSLRSRLYDNFISIKSIENIGEQEVISLETSTHTYISNGIISHNCIDDDSIVQSVYEKDIAWHAAGGNKYGIGLEMSGYARQTRQQWLDTFSTRMLKRSAKLSAYLCEKWNIPVVFVDAEGLKRGERGITTHNEITKAFKKGTHWDPGPNFPIDLYLKWINECLGE